MTLRDKSSEDLSLQPVDVDEQEMAEMEATMIAQADPSGMALTALEWKANRW